MKTKKDSFKFSDITASMREGFIRIPKLPDPDLSQVARTLRTLTTGVFLMGLAAISLTPFIFSNILTGAGITGTFLGFSLLVYFLNQKGKVQLAAQIFIYSIWIIDTVIIIFSGGFYSPYLYSYVTISVLGGLIMGGSTAYHYGGISILSIILIYVLNVLGGTPEPVIIFTPIALIIISIVGIFIPVWTLIMVILRYEENYNELIKKEQSLFQANQELNWEIRARKEAETLQLQSENRLRSALMDSPFPTLLHADDGEIVLVNSAWIENSGYTPRKLRTIDEWLNHCFRENGPIISEKISHLNQSSEKQYQGNFTLYKEDGTTRTWVLSWTQLPKLPDGRNLILTIASDMTDLMDIESALRESEENLSRFSLLTNDGIWDWDLQTDIVHFDPLYFTMAGYEVDEFPHRLEEFRKRVHPDDVERVFREADDLFSGKEDKFIVEFRFLKKDGTWLWIMGRGKITEQDENGNPLRFVGTHTDISLQKSVEEKLSHYQLQLEDIVRDRTQRLNERIDEVERLNAALTNILDDYQTANEKLSYLSTSLSDTYQELESFTYSVSNDLRIPLNKVKESSESLLQKLPAKLNQKNLDHISTIRENALLMDKLISGLLQLSQLGKQNLKQVPINPSSLVEEIIKQYGNEINERKIKIEIKELPQCLADENLIKIVFNNLISNAIKFTQKQTEPKITIGYQPDQSNNRVVFYVKDNGVGFNMKDQEKAFDTFQRLHTQEEFQGTGIGLALAKKIINRHGGEIWTDAAEKEGATFYFDLEQSKMNVR